MNLRKGSQTKGSTEANVKAHLVLIFSLGAVYLFRTRELLSVYWPNKAANDRETRGEPSPSQTVPLTSDKPKIQCSWSLSEAPGQVELSWAEKLSGWLQDCLPCKHLPGNKPSLTAEPGLVSPFWRPERKGWRWGPTGTQGSSLQGGLAWSSGNWPSQNKVEPEFVFSNFDYTDLWGTAQWRDTCIRV